jgi:hypothetical protein
VCNRDFWEGPVQRRRVKKERKSTKYIKRHQEKYKYKIFSFRRREAVLHTFHSPVAKTNRNYTLPHSLSLSLSLSLAHWPSHIAQKETLFRCSQTQRPHFCSDFLFASFAAFSSFSQSGNSFLVWFVFVKRIVSG